MKWGDFVRQDKNTQGVKQYKKSNKFKTQHLNQIIFQKLLTNIKTSDIILNKNTNFKLLHSIHKRIIAGTYYNIKRFDIIFLHFKTQVLNYSYI